MAKHKLLRRQPRQPQAAAVVTDAQQIIQNALSDNPEVCLVLEIAARARDIESIEQPISMDTCGSFAATAAISPVPSLSFDKLILVYV